MTASPASGPSVFSSDRLVIRAAVAAYLGRYRGDTRLHTESDLRVFLSWCSDQNLHPLLVARADIERYLRWLRLQPVARLFADVPARYRLCRRAGGGVYGANTCRTCCELVLREFEASS